MNEAAAFIGDLIGELRTSSGLKSAESLSSVEDLERQLREKLSFRQALETRADLVEAHWKDWVLTGSEDSGTKALLNLGQFFAQLSHSYYFSAEEQAAARLAAAISVSGLPSTVRIRRVVPQSWIKAECSEEDFTFVTRVTPALFRGMLAKAKNAIAPTGTAALSLLGSPSDRQQLSATDHLARFESQAATQVVGMPEYSRKGSELKISAMTLSAFRGAPDKMSLDLTKDGNPASILFFGDNASGKSTLVDAIEFAIQGRVGRVATTNSAIHPSIQNLASREVALSEAVLTDGSRVGHALDLSQESPSITGGPTPTGFTIAPLSIKRSDVLRFLTTDPLSRGTVFFDYFPEAEDALAHRPEEERLLLEGIQLELRVRRAGLARQLAASLGMDAEDFIDSSAFNATVRHKILDGISLTDAADSAVWAALDADIRDAILELRDVHLEASRNRGRLKGLENVLNPKIHAERSRVLQPILTEVGNDLTNSFIEITGADHIERIAAIFGESGPVSLDVVVEFKNGTTCYPQQAFSEGWQDLISLLFFLSLSLEAERLGQARVLILDDVFQSVDSSVRLAALEWICKRFKSWQLLLTIHDRLWLEQVRRVLARHNVRFREFRTLGWNFEQGFRIGGSTSHVESLSHALQEAEEVATCALAGRTLEHLSDALSQTLGTSLTRRSDDRYTLGDLWPGVAKRLKKYGLGSGVEEVTKYLDLRNIVGAHHNEWASTLPWSDAERFGIATLDLWDRTYCSGCFEFVSGPPDGELSCYCGSVRLGRCP